VCELGGPDECDFESIARMLRAAMGREVRYLDVCMPEARGMMEARGLNAARIRALTEYWDYVVSGAVCSHPCATVERLLGRPPRGLAAYLRELAAELNEPTSAPKLARV